MLKNNDGVYATLCLIIDRINSRHHPRQWPVAQVQTIAAIAIGLHQLRVCVKVLEHCLELRIPFRHKRIHCRVCRYRYEKILIKKSCENLENFTKKV